MTWLYVSYETYSKLSIILISGTFRTIYFLFRHIQPYQGIVRTLRNTCIFRTLLYSDSCHIYNSRYIPNSVKAYSGIFRTLCSIHILRTLPYSEFSHSQKFGIFRTGGIFRTLFIDGYSGIFNNDNYNNINSLFSL